MHHVHWWLFALSFFVGLGLTFALLARLVKVPARTSTGKSGAESESPTTEDPRREGTTDNEDPGNGGAADDEDPCRERDRRRRRSPSRKRLRQPRSPSPKSRPTTKIPVVPYAPYGPGSARAGAEGGGPAGWLVKGRSDTRLYYTPDDATYDRTVAQVWFKDEESAMRAYFTPWRKSSRK